MGFFSGLLIGAGLGLVAGWLYLPEPAFVREWWERAGFAKPTKLRV